MRPIPLCAALALSLWLADASAMDATSPDAGTGLDLSVPDDGARPTWGKGDPPGTWYGDTSGVPASEQKPRDVATVRRAACPTAPDGSDSTVTGSLTTGIGTSRAGTSRWNAASVNVCKEYTTDSGRSGTMNLQINVAEGDGPGLYHGPYHGFGRMHGPYPYYRGVGPGY
ncbi:hypothetical protein [Xanthomonas sp. XNM01]|uniref:hypothetical protein n=1 Tax=Xanthomonas sp. XNM01 TaxID=2769289 RepID=UPI001786A42D|nr:hypothetical protein [Xanthomonas sp. XNM01]MBD9369756.1 hypothetical protein [Xanthomonas sp. XNM01]